MSEASIPAPRRRFPAALLGALLLGLLLPAQGEAFTWPWEAMRGWPGSSDIPVTPLGHVTLEQREASFDPPAETGFAFAAFGDQRALADGEWQGMMTAIGREAARDPRLLFMLDTGDIVQSGKHSDQFARLRGILSPAARLPYLVGVGNHETVNNKPGPARGHVAGFLAYLDPDLGPSRLYYRKVVGNVRFLFLDTNDLVYGDRGDRDPALPLPPGSRGLAQLEWLADELDAPPGAYAATVVVLHHPLLHASEIHRAQSTALWNQVVRGRLLVDLFLDGGVDLVLTGHTHTYERFRVEREDGRALTQVNVSGRPRNSVLWFGASKRRPADLRGREHAWFGERGWRDLDRFRIVQEEVMLGEEANQFAIFRVDDRGGIAMELRFQDPGRLDTFRGRPPVVLAGPAAERRTGYSEAGR